MQARAAQAAETEPGEALTQREVADRRERATELSGQAGVLYGASGALTVAASVVFAWDW